VAAKQKSGVEPVTLSLDSGLLELVRDRARKEDRTLSAVVTRALRAYLLQPVESTEKGTP
jgi:Ribbon-helix-helix protein, copG family